MYNRYIPQSDGSYRRDRMAEPVRPQPAPPTPQRAPEEHHPPQQPPKPPITSPKPPQSAGNAGDFLRQLLPKNLDTGDLLIIVLLLLMSADCQEDRNTALLTLALYLIM